MRSFELRHVGMALAGDVPTDTQGLWTQRALKQMA